MANTNNMNKITMRIALVVILNMMLGSSCFTQSTIPQSPPAVIWSEPYYKFNKVLGVGDMIVTTGGDTNGLKPGYPAIRYIVADKHFWYWDMTRWQALGNGNGNGGTEEDPIFTASDAFGIVALDKTHWTTAYNKRPVSLAFTGTTTKTLTVTLGDATTITGTFTDNDGGATGVTSFNSRTGAVVPVSGDYTTTIVPEGSNLYYTTARQNTDFDIRLALKTTSNLTEGSNLYWTDARFDTRFDPRFDSRFDTRLATKTTSSLAEGSNLYWTNARFDTRFDTRLATKSTSDLVEGSRLYWTQARFDTAFGVKTTSNLAEGSNLYYTNARFDTRLATKTTSNLAEGSNLYYTTARFNTDLATKSTSDLSEGSNLYYTAARFNTALAAKTTSDLAEGTNLYFTNTRADARITVQKGAAGGLATLDGSSKVPIAQLPAGSQTYQGTWNATTNTPTLVDGTGTAGDTYRVTVGGTRNLGSGSIVWTAGDDAIYNGTIWQRNPAGGAAVSSVNGATGAVVLTTDDIAEGANLYFSSKTTTDLPEGTGLYYTDVRVRAAVSGTGGLSYNSGTGAFSVTNTAVTPGTYTYPSSVIVNSRGQLTGITSGTVVNTVFGRSGTVVATSGDYTTTQVTEGTNLYYTTARVRGAISASGSLAYNSSTGDISYTTPAIPAQFNPIAGTGIAITGTYPNMTFTAAGAGVSSFNTRTGAVVSATNDYTFAQIGSKPTTLAGYGITDAALATHTHTFASLTSKPTTLAGYGITDAAPLVHTHTFASLTSKPTTILGYGITDAYDKGEVDSIVAAGGGLGDCGVINVGAVNTNGFTWTITDPTNNVNLLLNQQFGVADGSTTGRVGFNANDFLTTSGIARLNYASGQSGSATVKGYIIPTDWSRFDAKADVPTGAVSTRYTTNMVANRVAISNGAGKFADSRIDTAHLGFLGLVRSDIQTQIDNVSAGTAGPFTVTVQPANYTITLGDAQEVIRLTQSTAQTLSVPTNATVAFPIGTNITIVQDNTGTVTITPISGVTVNSSNGLKTRARFSAVTLIKTGTNVWLATGDLTP